MYLVGAMPAVCCSVLQWVWMNLAGNVPCSMLQDFAMRPSVLQQMYLAQTVPAGVAVCCSVLWCTAVCSDGYIWGNCARRFVYGSLSSVLWCVAVCCSVLSLSHVFGTVCVAECCRVLQSVVMYCVGYAVCCGALPCVAPLFT